MSAKKETNIEKSRTAQVRKSNALVMKGRYSLDIQQQKILLYLISKVQKGDDQFAEITFDCRTFCRICGIKLDSGKNYINLKKAIKDLADTSYWVDTEDGRKEGLVRWIDKAEVDKITGAITMKLHQSMQPHLLNLGKNFTHYELIWTLNFKSKYSIRLYEIVKSIHFHEDEEFQRVFSLDEMKEMLDAKSYTAFPNFRIRVLEPAISEINAASDKNVKVIYYKSGRTVTEIGLIVTTKTRAEIERIHTAIQKKLGARESDPAQITINDITSDVIDPADLPDHSEELSAVAACIKAASDGKISDYDCASMASAAEDHIREIFPDVPDARIYEIVALTVKNAMDHAPGQPAPYVKASLLNITAGSLDQQQKSTGARKKSAGKKKPVQAQPESFNSDMVADMERRLEQRLNSAYADASQDDSTY